MKKLLILASFIAGIWQQGMAQNEGRLSIYTGISRTSLNNADDKKQDDLTPTFKPSVGIQGAYHFTLFKKLPLGFSANAEYAGMGQNYRGEYQDSNSYYAYSRLSYFRLGFNFHASTNPRRQVALTYSSGIMLGFLSNYQERYEVIRYNNDRLIMDIQNNNATVSDTALLTGSLKNPLYNKSDLVTTHTLGLDFLISKKLVFGFYGRFDLGLKSVETNLDNAINLDTKPASVFQYQPNRLPTKHRGEYTTDPKRGPTNNMAMGIYFTLRYRLYNPEKVEFWYKEKSF